MFPRRAHVATKSSLALYILSSLENIKYSLKLQKQFYATRILCDGIFSEGDIWIFEIKNLSKGGEGSNVIFSLIKYSEKKSLLHVMAIQRRTTRRCKVWLMMGVGKKIQAWLISNPLSKDPREIRFIYRLGESSYDGFASITIDFLNFSFWYPEITETLSLRVSSRSIFEVSSLLTEKSSHKLNKKELCHQNIILWPLEKSFYCWKMLSSHWSLNVFKRVASLYDRESLLKSKNFSLERQQFSSINVKMWANNCGNWFITGWN